MKLFSKGKSAARAAAAPAPFQPTDRANLMARLEQVVSAGQSGVLSLRNANGEWTYAFQGGGLVHASGGRTRGARQAFDLLWEFDSGEFLFTTESGSGLGSNLYIDKGRLLGLLRQSQAALQAPGSPSLPTVQPTQAAPAPPSGWGAGVPPQSYPTAKPLSAPVPQAPAVNLTPQPFQVPASRVAPPGLPPPAAAAPIPPLVVVPPMPPPTPPAAAAKAPPAISPPPPAVAPQPPRSLGRSIAAPPPAPASFSVPPMPIPRRREAAPGPLIQSSLPARGNDTQAAPKPAVETSKPPSTPQDDLKSLRASLAAQAPSPEPASRALTWKVRKPDGTASAPGETRKGAKPAKSKKPSRLKAFVEDKTIRFLLWACERSYSPDDHWTVKDAFEVATLELRDQFLGAFSQAFKPRGAGRDDDDDINQVTAGRMRGRARPRKR